MRTLVWETRVSKRVLKGWYSSTIVLPEKGFEVIWLDLHGREVVGTCDEQGNWYTADGQYLRYAPSCWRYAKMDNPDSPDTHENRAFSRWLANYSRMSQK